ncbi:hypothetical protein FN846DRAFT_775964 [Sphaerosporella brunnea]|uniref:Uncharacterized protein n=1 Tax=Sphaerosporella brunnea TaxID=1250544 RepID=A0A5J5F273_9PEZI|nr:hypothetical protein FN846DRAFT_775964 [Sphaerosporella brunnea]
MYAKLPLLLLLSAGLASITTASAPHLDERSIGIVPRQNQGNNNQNNGNKNNNNALQLNPANVQDASQATGQAAGAEAGQSASATDNANFINFCSGKTLTNGAQVTGGSCNGIVMGDIPSQNNMVSSIIVSPQPGENIAANTPFNIQVQVANLAAGSFTNPQNTYYAAPQALSGGKIVGHTHVTVQDLGNSLTPNTPPDATTFAFFKGINDNGNGNGLLSASVTQGLPAGNYRVCTMSSASNHQPVLMPVAQRGAQDDCTKFTVGQGNNNNNNNQAGNAAGNGAELEGTMSSSNDGEVCLPPEVAAELAGYLRSSLFAPLSSNITRLCDDCEENMKAQKDLVQDVQAQISEVIEPTAEKLVPIAEELKDVYRQIELLEVLFRLCPCWPPTSDCVHRHSLREPVRTSSR